jgi:hypothetical protein
MKYIKKWKRKGNKEYRNTERDGMKKKNKRGEERKKQNCK